MGEEKKKLSSCLVNTIFVRGKRNNSKSYNRYDYYKDHAKIAFVVNSEPRGSVIIDVEDADKMRQYYFTAIVKEDNSIRIITTICKRGYRSFEDILFNDEYNKLYHKNGDKKDFRRCNMVTREGLLLDGKKSLKSSNKSKNTIDKTNVYERFIQTQNDIRDFVTKPKDDFDIGINDDSNSFIYDLFFSKVPVAKKIPADKKFIDNILNQTEIYSYLSNITRTNEIGYIKSIRNFEDFYTIPSFKKASSNEERVIKFILPKLLFDESIDVLDISYMNYYRVIDDSEFYDGIEMMRSCLFNDDHSINIKFNNLLVRYYYSLLLIDDGVYGITTFGSSKIIII